MYAMEPQHQLSPSDINQPTNPNSPLLTFHSEEEVLCPHAEQLGGVLQRVFCHVLGQVDQIVVLVQEEDLIWCTNNTTER